MLNPLGFDGLQRLIGSSKVFLMRFLRVPCYSIDSLAELACLWAVAEGPIVPATAPDDRRLCSRNESAVPSVMNPGLYADHLVPFARGVSAGPQLASGSQVGINWDEMQVVMCSGKVKALLGVGVEYLNRQRL